MNTYIEKTLSDGEVIKEYFYYHWVIYIFLVANFILAVLTLGVWLPCAIYYCLSMFFTERAITNRRVIHKYGIIGRYTSEMRVGAIESVSISQGVVGRILNYGDVLIYGKGAGKVTLRCVAKPLAVKRAIESAI